MPVAQIGGRVQNGTMPEGWYTTAQVAAMLGLDQQQVRDMRRAGKFPHAEKQGTVWLIPEVDLQNVETPKMGRPKKIRRRGRPPKIG